MEVVEDTLTALERKWLEESKDKGPTIDDVFTDDGKLAEEKLDESVDRKSTRLNSSHMSESRMPSSA